MRAQERYQDSKGDFYAAGITYFTIFALFPLLMVGFAAGGFVLASRPTCWRKSRRKIKARCPATWGSSSIQLMDSAIAVAYLGRHHRPGDRRVGGAGLDGQPA